MPPHFLIDPADIIQFLLMTNIITHFLFIINKSIFISSACSYSLVSNFLFNLVRRSANSIYVTGGESNFFRRPVSVPVNSPVSSECFLLISMKCIQYQFAYCNTTLITDIIFRNRLQRFSELTCNFQGASYYK